MSFSLLPRLNYKYSIRDFIIQMSILFSKSIEHKQIDDFFGSHCFFYNHGRTAMRIALSSLGLEENAKIGLMTFNCLTVLNSINDAGFVPEFIETTEDFRIDLADLLNKKNKLDALIVTHMFGIPNYIVEIRKLLPDLPIIEDCAHSFFTKINEKLLGSISDMAVFSFGLAKFPSVGDGGFLVVNNDKYMQQVQENTHILNKPTLGAELSNIIRHILLCLLHKPIIYKNLTLPYLKSVDNRNDYSGKYKTTETLITNTNKFLFLKYFLKTSSLLNIQRNNAIKIINTLNINKLTLEGNCFMIPILTSTRSSVINDCMQDGVEIGAHFSNCISWAVKFGYIKGSCPTSEYIAHNILTIPCHYHLKNKEIIKIINVLEHKV